MKLLKPSLLLVLLFSSLSMMGQNGFETTDNPHVDKQYRSQWGKANVVRVAIDEENTFVFIEYISNKNANGIYISLASTTSISSRQVSGSLKIQGWGVMTIDESDINELELDEQYEIMGDRKYTFVLVFPHLASSVTKFDINENVGSEGFVWKGIRLNARVDKSTKDDHQYKNDYSEKQSGSSSQDDYHRDSNVSGSFGSGSHDTYPSMQRKRKVEITGSGTCFAVSEDGYLATCYHVVQGAQYVQIRGVNGDFDNPLEARVVSVDKEKDLALVKIIDSHFNSIGSIPYSLNTSSCDVGDAVYVLGYPMRALMGDEIKLTDGIVSSLSGYQGDVGSYQVTATVQPGNSGGPAFDKDGRVIGVVGARLYVENATYAVKSNYLCNLVSNEGLKIPMGDSSLRRQTLTELVKKVKPYVYIIEVGE